VHQIGEHGRRRAELAEQAARQRTEREARRHGEGGAPAAGPLTGGLRQLAHPGAAHTEDDAAHHALQEPGSEEQGERVAGGGECQGRQPRQDDARDRDAAPSQPVGQLTGEEQGRDEAGGVAAEQGGEHLRREVQPFLVDEEQRGRDVRAGRDGEQREHRSLPGHRPTLRTAATARRSGDGVAFTSRGADRGSKIRAALPADDGRTG